MNSPTTATGAATATAPPAALVARLLLGCLVVQAAWMAWAWSDLQAPLAPDDHGWNLYAFWRVAEGEAPYRDFGWSYGPLMPYLYAAAFRLFGFKITTVLATHGALLGLAAVLGYALARRVASPGWSFLAGTALLSIGLPFHAYVHVGTMPLLLGSMLAFLRWLEDSPRRARWLALACALQVLQAGVLWTLAGSSAAALTLAAFLVEFHAGRAPGGALAPPPVSDARRLARATGVACCFGLAWALGTILLYAPLLVGVPAGHLRHCFGIHGGEIPKQGLPFYHLFSVPLGVWDHFAAPADAAPPWSWILHRDRLTAFLGLLTGVAGLAATLRLLLTRAPAGARALALTTLFLVGLLTSHQYLWQGAPYSLFWGPSCAILPFAACLGETASAYVLRRVPVDLRPRLRAVAALAAGVAALAATLVWRQTLPVVEQRRESLLRLDRGRVYGGGPALNRVLEGVVGSVRALTAPGEKIAVFPYAPIYPYLADRPSAVYHQQLSQVGDLTPEEERAVIDALESAHVRVVLLTNQASMARGVEDLFGRDYALELAAYLATHFEPVEQFGDGPWTPTRAWVAGHQVMVLRRRE
ncbi:MAG: hypothetical protein HYZ53_23450 [Planctomycetes bacterium]|nr:hypothetical protein [Planctomycetota bacterium]